MILTVLMGLGVAFWAGRASVPGTAADLTDSGRLSSIAAERAGAGKPGRQSEPGGGGQAVTSALQLRGLFRNSGGNWQTGAAAADAALAKMNGSQLSQLVHSLATAQATTPGYSYSREINAACARWAEVDPDAALRFALSNKQASFRYAAIGSIIAGIAKNDPVAAAKRVMQLPVDMQKSGVVAIAKVWAGKDSAAATAWAQSLSDPQQRNQALAAIAGGIAAQDPDAALASLASLTPTARRAGIASVFGTLADLDFDAALPDGDMKTSAISNLASNWAREDFDAAGQWKESDPDKDRAAVNQADLTSDERDRLLKQIK